MSEKNAGRGGSNGAGGCDVVILLQLEDLAAADASHVDPTS